MSEIAVIGQSDFERDVLDSDTPVLVDFWAPWCGPCVAVTPLLLELAAELDGRARIVKLNIDENPELAARYRVASIPSFLLFKGGKVADRMMGAMPKGAFRDFLERNL